MLQVGSLRPREGTFRRRSELTEQNQVEMNSEKVTQRASSFQEVPCADSYFLPSPLPPDKKCKGVKDNCLSQVTAPWLNRNWIWKSSYDSNNYKMHKPYSQFFNSDPCLCKSNKQNLHLLDFKARNQCITT